LKYTLLDDETQKKRSDSTPVDVQLEIEHFYSKNATIINNKNAAMKDVTPKQILTMTTNKLYAQYATEIRKHVSLSKFRKMRPGFVLTVKNHRFNHCLCEYCVNMEEKLKVITAEVKKFGGEELPKLQDKYDLINLTLCDKDVGLKYYNPKCIARECESCGPHLLSQRLKPLLDAEEDTQVKWSVWLTEKFVTKQKSTSAPPVNVSDTTQKGTKRKRESDENEKEEDKETFITKKCYIIQWAACFVW